LGIGILVPESGGSTTLSVTDRSRDRGGDEPKLSLATPWLHENFQDRRLSRNDRCDPDLANNKNPDEKQPGEHPDGKFHYNPGNMAGKKPGDAESTEENRGDISPAPQEKLAG
jgi:hypothetical protein